MPASEHLFLLAFNQLQSFYVLGQCVSSVIRSVEDGFHISQDVALGGGRLPFFRLQL